MKFLVDNSVSYLVSKTLQEAGHDAIHVRDMGLQNSPDTEIFQNAYDEDRVLIAADTDFGTLLALRNQSKPSVILFRKNSTRNPDKQYEILQEVLPKIDADLAKGCIVVITENHLRIRDLPINS